MILFAGLFLNLSCREKAENEAKYGFREDEVIVDLANVVVSPLFASFSIGSYDNESFHIFKDEFHNIVLTSLNDFTLKKVIKVKTGDGPDVVGGNITGVFQINTDRFLIQADPYYYVINDEGYVIKRLNLLGEIEALLDTQLLDDFSFLILTNKGPMSKAANGEFIFTIARTKNVFGGPFPQYQQFAKVKIKDNLDFEIKLLDIFFPKEFILDDNMPYGQLEIPQLMVYGEWMAYNYNFSSKVFMYNLATSESKTLNLEISNGSGFSLTDKQKILSPSSEKQTNFSYPLIDFKNEIIYRSHIVIHKGAPMNNDNFLCAYAFTGQKLAEHSIGKNSDRMLRNGFIYEGNLYMNHFYPLSDEELRMVRFRFLE